MKFVKFWRMAVKELTPQEKLYYRDMLKKLSTWQTMVRQYPEFGLIQEILESEIPAEQTEDTLQKKHLSSGTHMKLHYTLSDCFTSFNR